jgi:hypothetical protein
MRRTALLIATTALLALAAPMLAGCGVGSGGPESKISETTDSYLRFLASGDTTKACAQLTVETKSTLGASCTAAMETIARRIGRDKLTEAADQGLSISVDGSNGTATLKGLNDARIGLVDSGSSWLIESGYALDGGSGA